MARSAGSLNINIKNLSFPIKLHVASKEETVSFKNVSPDGNLVKNLPIVQEVIDPDNFVDSAGKKIPKKDCLRGIEVSKGKYAVFNDEDIAELGSKKSDGIYIESFCTNSTIDPILYNGSYYVVPELASSEEYGLMADRLKKTKKIAIGTMIKSGKDSPVALRYYDGGILLHSLFRSDEIRVAPSIKLEKSSKENNQLFDNLINDMMVDEIDHALIDNDFNTRVLNAAKQKVKTDISKSLK